MVTREGYDIEMQQNISHWINETVESACLKCNEQTSTEATKCPAGGYEPNRGDGSEAGIAKLWGLLISLTIIGVIVGILLWWYKIKCQKKANGMKPTNTEPDQLTAPPYA